MSDNNIISQNKNNDLWNKLSIVFGNPVINLVIATLLGIVGTWFFYMLIEAKEIKPRYAVSREELIAEQILDTDDLKLLWNGVEIENVKSVKIGIWNSGRQYLSQDEISDDYPIRVKIPPGVQVLYSKFIYTTRPTLQFSTSFFPSGEDRQFIQINFDNDEAVERYDGGILKILYTGEPKDDFSVTGRIFGSKTGFIETGWHEHIERTTVFLMLIAFGYLLVRIVGFTLKIIRNDISKYKAPGVNIKLKILFSILKFAGLGCFTFGFAWFAWFLYDFILPYILLPNPSWLIQ